jgi:hypothetical protein
VWETFFKCQRSPVLRSQILAALMCGTPFTVDKLPVAALPDVALLATASRGYCEAEIVDDYAALLGRVEEEWRRSEWTCRAFDSSHLNCLDFICKGTREFVALEDAYIPALVRWVLAQEVPQYFKKELTQ